MRVSKTFEKEDIMGKTAITEQVREEYIQWLKDTGKMTYQLTDVFVNDIDVIKTEKKMAWSAKTSHKDWKEFCDIKGIKYDDEIILFTIN
jgi:hypothetical protein